MCSSGCSWKFIGAPYESPKLGALAHEAKHNLVHSIAHHQGVQQDFCPAALTGRDTLGRALPGEANCSLRLSGSTSN